MSILIRKSDIFYSGLAIPFVITLLFVKSVVFIKYGLTFKVYFIFYFFLFFILVYLYKIKLSKLHIIFYLSATVSIFFNIAFHSYPPLFFLTGNIIISLMTFSIVDEKLFKKIIQLSTLLILLMLIGALITFFDAYLNGITENKFIAEGGREIPRGILSLGHNAYGFNDVLFFRASSIYDEPGAFSFVICFIAAIRHILNMNKKYTWLILILGFVTFSLAHVIYVFFHFISEKGKKKLIFLSLPLIYIVFLLYYDFFYKLFYVLVSRFEIVSFNEGFFKGNNRFEYFIYSIEKIKTFTTTEFLFGLSLTNETRCCNSFVPFLRLGLIGSWPSYIIYFLILFLSFKYKSPIIFAIFLLLTQRPEIEEAGSSFLVAALIFAMKYYKNYYDKENV